MPINKLLHRFGRLAAALALGLALAPGATQAQQLDPLTGEAVPAGAALDPAALAANAQTPGRGGEELTLIARLADGETRGLDLVGDVLYRSNGGYLETLDVSDPEAPEVLGRFLVEQAVVVGVDVAGDYAYIAAQRPNLFGNRGSLQIVDVSDPANPTFAGQVAGMTSTTCRSPARRPTAPRSAAASA